MNRLIRVIIVFLSLYGTKSFANFDLQKGLVESDNAALFLKIYRTKRYPDAITNMGVGQLYYFYKGTELYLIDIGGNQKIGAWPLTEAEEILEPVPEFVELKRDLGVPITYDRMVGDPTIGCMGNNPLKYGDIESDGKKELVVFIKNTLQIFSVEQKKVVFSVQLDVDDWYTKEYSKEIISELRDTSESLPEDPQYQSRSYYDAGGSRGTLVALRGYSKLFVGHYSAENDNDILVWRKLYKSNLVNNPVAGFAKLGDAYVHYKLIGGIYKKQPTSPDTIKGWLAEKNLTWQKGYPSKSECPGQEGQLIPEMHHPLLNDPDVLK